MSSNLYAVFESRVRAFDPATKIATIIIPGSYGMEPFDAPPFTRRGMDPSLIEDLTVGDRVLVVQGENEVPEWLSTNPDWMGVADDRYVNVIGDTMTGELTMTGDLTMGTSANISSILGGHITIDPGNIYFGFDTRQMLNLYANAYAIGVQTNCLYLRTGSEFAWFRGGVHSDTNEDPGSGGVEEMTLRVDGLYLPDPSMQNLVLGAAPSSGPRLRLHYPGSGNNTYIDFEGATPGAGVLNLRSGTTLAMQISPTFTDFYAGGTYRGRLAADVLVAKAATDTTSIGVALTAIGRIYATTTASNTLNFISNIVTAIDNNPHISFRRSDVEVGSIRMNGTAAVAYGTSSDLRFKHVLGEIDDDEAIAKVLAYRPVKYQMKLDENQTPSVTGVPTGRVEWGLLAQEAIDVDPVPVSVGEGEPGDEGFYSWSIDYGRLSPDILAATRALIHRVEALTLELAELRGSAPSN